MGKLKDLHIDCVVGDCVVGRPETCYAQIDEDEYSTDPETEDGPV